MFKRLDDWFTPKRRGAAALAAIGFALVWMFLWNAFPMEFYSFFFYKTSYIGSNIQLLLLNAVVLLPLFWVFTKLTKIKLGFSKTVLLNLPLLMAADFAFSVFAFGDRLYICVIALAVHWLINVWTFGSAETYGKKAPKGMNAPPPKGATAIKEQPVTAIVWAAAFAFVSEALSFSLLYIVAHIYAY
ncbi:MAG: hypothetical protein NC395_03745 [Prevotella sp.]|nr:hypothetical protein [Prevotella sp.]